MKGSCPRFQNPDDAARAARSARSGGRRNTRADLVSRQPVTTALVANVRHRFVSILSCRARRRAVAIRGAAERAAAAKAAAHWRQKREHFGRKVEGAAEASVPWRRGRRWSLRARGAAMPGGGERRRWSPLAGGSGGDGFQVAIVGGEGRRPMKPPGCSMAKRTDTDGGRCVRQTRPMCRTEVA